MRSDAALVLDILLAARKIQRYTAGMDEDTFGENDLVQSAVIREFQVIGEAARLISDTMRHTHPEVPWHSIAGMRNRLIHEYFDIRLDVVWDTIQDNLAPLIAQLETIVPPEDDE
jgi:uncharacterized protein with HEPN domain